MIFYARIGSKAHKNNNPPCGGLQSPYWSLLTPWNPVAYCPFVDTYPLPASTPSASTPCIGLASASRSHDRNIPVSQSHNRNKGVIGPQPKQIGVTRRAHTPFRESLILTPIIIPCAGGFIIVAYRH